MRWWMWAGWVVSVASCAHVPAPEPVSEPALGYSQEWVLITVRSARLSPLDNGWDTSSAGSGFSVAGLASLAGYVQPAAGALLSALGSLFPSSSPVSAASAATNPDPVVVVTHHGANVDRVSRSAVVPNSLHPNWDYAFYEHLPSLRAAGLDVAVLDDDEGESDENAGSVNLSLAQLIEVTAAGRVADLEVSDNGTLENLLLRVEPVPVRPPSAPVEIRAPLASGVVPTQLIIPAGAVVTIRTRGAGRISKGSWGCPPDVTPAGIANGKCASYNLKGYPPLSSAAHGSAVALLGVGTDVRGLSLANGVDTQPCVEITAPTSGPLVLGVNDRDLANNSGEFVFEVSVNTPATTPRPSCPSTARRLARGGQQLPAADPS